MDWSAFKIFGVTAPLVLGNGAGIASTFEDSSVWVKLIALAFLFRSLVAFFVSEGVLNVPETP
jgi:hypothetical protein